jgi:hypothetical protein
MTSFKQTDADRRNARKSTGRQRRRENNAPAAMPSAMGSPRTRCSVHWKMLKITKRLRRPLLRTTMLNQQ